MRNFTLLFFLIMTTLGFSRCSLNKTSDIAKEVPGSKPAEEKEEQDGILESQKMEFSITKDMSLGYVPKERLVNAYQELMRMRQSPGYSARVAALTWAERGPNTDVPGPYGNPRPGNGATSGRIRAIWVDLADVTNRTVWLGGVDGGLWKTTDITAVSPVWTLVNDFFGNLAIGSICQDPSNTQIMYFGTGEKSFNADAVRGGGVWKSINGGTTWTLLANTTNFWNVSKILCDAAGNVYVATIGSGVGLQRSINGGTSWTSINPTGLSTRTADMEISSTGRLHITSGYFNSTPATSGYRFTDNPSTVTSATWTSPTTAFTPVEFNSEIAVVGNTLYAAPSDASFQNNQMWKSVDGGANWAITTTTPTIVGNPALSSGQAWYCVGLAIDPTNANNVMVGGLNSYISTNGGTSWTINSIWVTGVPGSTNYIHADHQAIVWNNNQVLDVGDGGIFYSADDGVTFASRNTGLRLKQFYAAAIHPTTTNYFLAGAQDNGVHQLTNAGLGGSTEITGGDGAFVHIDQDEPQYQFGAYVFNDYRRSVDGGNNWANVAFSGSLGRFINPSDYDDVNNNFYAAWDNGQIVRWNNAPSLTTGNLIAVAAFGGSKASCFTVSPYTANRLFVGSGPATNGVPAGGQIVRIDNAQSGAPAITDITGSGMSASNVSCVAVGTTDNNLLAVFSNYGAIHIWVSTTGGGAGGWTNISNNIPDVPVRWAMFYPDDNTRAIVATEMGIYETDLINGATTNWVQNSTFPVVKTNMLQYRSSDRTVLAATHGRGLWTATIPATIPYIRFTSPLARILTEATAATTGCRRYTDYTISMPIDMAPVGASTATLSIAGGGTAVQGTDFDFTTNGNFAAPSSALTYPNGSATAQSFTLRVYDDAEVEANETFTFNFSTSGGNAQVAPGGSSSYTVTIISNDIAPTVQVIATVGAGVVGFNQPFRGEFTDAKTQMVFQAAEMTGAGFSAGMINSIALNVTTKASTAPYLGFTIKMKNTNTLNMTAGVPFEGGATTVFGPVNYSTVAGINTFVLTTPFVWDGTSSLMIEFCFDNAVSSAADIVVGTGAITRTQFDRQNGVAGCALGAATFQFGGGGGRPNITFNFGNAVETVLSSTRTEHMANNGDYYFYNSANGNIFSRILNASASLGCVNSTIFEAGTTWQTFLGGQRSQKVFDVAPTTNPAATYNIALYFTSAELAGNSAASLRIAKTTAATIAGANSGNTVIVTPTVTAFGTGSVFTAPFSGFSKFFLVTPGVALPVDLLSFSGYLDTRSHSALQWQTTNQTNLQHFELQRSYDGVNFVTAGTVNAIQNPAQIQGYSFNDPLVAKAVNFYRLRMVDFDARFKYSAIIKITNNKPSQFIVLLQNPVTDNISFLISNEAKENVAAELLSSSGQLIRRWNLGKVDGNVVLPFNNTPLASGIYTLRVTAGNKAESLKISKQ